MKVILILFLSTCISISLSAQSTSRVSGRVLSIDEQPATQVTVVIDDRQIASTQDNGQFNISLKPGSHILEISYLGKSIALQEITVVENQSLILEDIMLKETAYQLRDVVVTGQYETQSLKRSVFQVRTVSKEQIRLRAATNLQQVLSTELGIRIVNDLTLGTADVQLLGVSGQRVKILLDGLPLLDRGDTRESLGQVDINTIDHIEIVEGPMSVMYGTDALGGVINLITRKAAAGNNSLVLGFRVQEESTGRQYKSFSGKGSHNQGLNVRWQKRGFSVLADVSRNDFGGWDADNGLNNWLPKDQLLGSLTTGYKNQKLQVWYRINATNEDFFSQGVLNPGTSISKDQNYITNRYMHQLQADLKANSKLSLNVAASYTDYSRRTRTTEFNHLTSERRLTAMPSEQAEAIFDNKFIRGTGVYKILPAVSLQPGFEVNLTGSSGDRILGTPSINDYAFFVSSEIALGSGVNIRPGVRFINNSVYDAPPVIPSINAKIALSPALDLRMGYARGFRSPALRELYFNFVDASHSIYGNEDLKAEYSNSYNGSINWQVLKGQRLNLNSVLGGFYNRFHNFIGTANVVDGTRGNITTYLNIEQYRTLGITFENTIIYKNLQATVGLYYIGRYNRLQNEDPALPEFTWTPELNSNITYSIKPWKTSLSLFYKLNGKRPTYEYVPSTTTTRRASISAYNTADLTINKTLRQALSLTGGMRNVFNVTQVNNTSLDTGAAHSTGGSVAVGYGRSVFLGINYQFSK
jgi:outer membrane receptor for ferrienterochelin and colicins